MGFTILVATLSFFSGLGVAISRTTGIPILRALGLSSLVMLALFMVLALFVVLYGAFVNPRIHDDNELF